MNDLIVKLHSLGAIKLGSFEIKKDFLSPFQVDLIGVLSHPKTAKEVCAALWEKAKHLTFDIVCGASLQGLCFANYLAWTNEVPLVVRRMGGGR